MSNVLRAARLIQRLAELGVKEFCVCAGARNAPLVSVLNRANGIKVHRHFEERSAAFFALGRIKSTARPVAVVTTSGTAAAELLPAAIEAHYSGCNLILITADRPRRYRGSGAPQSIEQVGLYSSYVSASFDLEAEELPKVELSNRPVHFNICFDEPLLDNEIPTLDLQSVNEGREASRAKDRASFVSDDRESRGLEQFANPLVILGGMSPREGGKVAEWLDRFGLPFIAEAHSNLRHSGLDRELLLPDGLFENLMGQFQFDSVIRVGGVPTMRFWRDLESKWRRLPVAVVSHLPFSGLSRNVQMCSALPEISRSAVQVDRIGEWNAQFSGMLNSLLTEFPLSEPSQIYFLSKIIPDHSRIYLGNSLPIRDWDLAADQRHKNFWIEANRGANGIDGQISTFLGFADQKCENWGIVGDLTALYDLSAPWALRDHEVSSLNLVIINNGGGKIFRKIFNDSNFENTHNLQFRSFAEMWGWDYQAAEDVRKITPKAGRPRIIEVIPDWEQTEKFWARWNG